MEGRGRGPARRREETSHTRGGEGAGGLVPGCDTSRVVCGVEGCEEGKERAVAGGG